MHAETNRGCPHHWQKRSQPSEDPIPISLWVHLSTEDIKISAGAHFFRVKTASAYMKDRLHSSFPFRFQQGFSFCDLAFLNEALLPPPVDVVPDA